MLKDTGAPRKASKLSGRSAGFLFPKSCMTNKYEDELEVLMLHNPRGGRPQKIGVPVYLSLEPPQTVVEISSVKEDTSTRFFLGYCHCGKKLTAGEKRALIMMDRLARRLNIESMDDLQARLLKQVMSSYPQHPENLA